MAGADLVVPQAFREDNRMRMDRLVVRRLAAGIGATAFAAAVPAVFATTPPPATYSSNNQSSVDVVSPETTSTYVKWAANEPPNSVAGNPEGHNGDRAP